MRLSHLNQQAGRQAIGTRATRERATGTSIRGNRNKQMKPKKQANEMKQMKPNKRDKQTSYSPARIVNGRPLRASRNLWMQPTVGSQHVFD